MSKRALPTTVVGSHPKPSWLWEAFGKLERGQMTREEFEERVRDAGKITVKDQELAGVDIIWEGEMRRRDMIEYLAGKMEGFVIYGDVRVWGNNYYRKPSIVAPVRYRDEWAVDDFTYLRGITDKDIKVPLTGPYTMAEWCFNECYGSKRELVIALAEAEREEVERLVRAGAGYIQIDEPAIPTRPEEIDIAEEGVEIVTGGSSAYFGIHICYGDYSKIFPGILDFPVDQLTLEFANKEFVDLEWMGEYSFADEDLGLGCIDVHTRRVEKVGDVKRAIGRALEKIDPRELYVNPDCGLKLLPRSIAFEKMRVMCQAAKELRDEL